MTVYFSNVIPKRYPKMFKEIAACLEENKIPYSTEVPGTNRWLRDYAPIKSAGGYCHFMYERCPKLVTPQNWFRQFDHAVSPIYLDGGNVEQSDTHVLMTEMVFKNNPKIKRSKLIDQLEEIFGKELVLLPFEPGDDLGHIDGIARFIDNEHAFINDYSVMEDKRMDRYFDKLVSILDEHSITAITFPYAYHKCPKITEKTFRRNYKETDYFNPAVSYYINFYHIKNVVLMPQFGLGFEQFDARAVQMAKDYFPRHVVKPIYCFPLAMLGGVLQCTTWEH